MVSRGEWGLGDDRRMLRAIYAAILAGASQEYDLDWEALVAGREAAAARRRWRLMLRVVPEHRDLEFVDAVEALVER